uniref:Olfactory receptor n=1 Tax=Moschus moschiferus TaxID=68415 RepID=A0A8C6CH17_MOSMO
MENCNQTSTDFVLLGLFPSSRFGLFLFILIVLIFLLALFGNLSMILLIFLDIHLHKPMYFLLSQLSLIDLNYISTIVPKMVYNYLFGNKSISFIGCGVQSFFFLALAGAEALLLASMAYDRCVAICFPLHYPIKISRQVRVLMIIGSWIMGSINSYAHTTYALQIPYCRSRAINHFFCDVPAMLTLACMDTWIYEYTVFVSTILFLLCPFIGIVCSYVVTFYYAPFVYTYLRPRYLRSPTEDKALTVFYTILTPVLNPVICSLKNKEVMGALRRAVQRICSVKL